MHAFLTRLNERRLRAYQADPGLLKEHFGIEEAVLAGGYGYRQVLELVQNGADALLEARQRSNGAGEEGRIHVQIHGDTLYVANTGAPLSEDGLDALLRSHSSPKRGNQIGRFGLGFKSLLKLDGRIDLFTRASGAIRFDPKRCRDELSRRFGVADAPSLRLAWALSPDERAADPVCAELGWAETIVRVEVCSQSLLDHLKEEIRSFPAEFLLFFPAAATLTLDAGEGKPRELRLVIDRTEHLLHDGEALSRWRISEREVRVTDARALADATHIHARESVPIAWAVPLEGRREEVGRFWAFFPTQTLTYLPGILNAPWKLNSDRNAIIGGEWNAGLMNEAARLIAATLADLATPEDPARPLDAFPRQLDRKDEDAAPLVDSLWTFLKTAAVIPDGTGALRRAHDLWRHPRDSLALADAWQAIAADERRRQLVHSSCLERQRASRLNALAERLEVPGESNGPPALRRCSAGSWFGIVASKSPALAGGVLRLAEAFSNDSKPTEWAVVRPTLAIIPTQTGALVAPAHAVLSAEGVVVPGRASVAGFLQSDPTVLRVLRDVLQVKELDDQVWHSILSESIRVPAWPAGAVQAGWETFWSRLRSAPAAVRKAFLEQNRQRIRVHRRDGNWVPPDCALLPGGLVDEGDRTTNCNLLVDGEAIGDDLAMVAALRLSDVPIGDVGPASFGEISGDQDLLHAWREACRHLYKQMHINRASWGYLEPLPLSMPRGYGLLPQLAGVPKARFTYQLLGRLPEPAFQSNVRFGHSTMPAYPQIDVAHPLPWFLASHGEVHLGSAVTSSLRAFAARRDKPSLRYLPGWSDLQSKLDRLDTTFPPVTASATDLRAFWESMFAALVTADTLGSGTLSELWLDAAEDGTVPTSLPARSGSVPLSAAFVTTSADLAQRARTSERIIVVLDPTALALWRQAGAQDLSHVVRAEWDGTAGPAERLMHVVPELAAVLGSSTRDAARCQRVSRLRLKVGDAAGLVPCLMWDGTLHLDDDQLAHMSRAERLRHIISEVAVSGWLAYSQGEALLRVADAKVDERRLHVAHGSTLSQRLLRCVGNRVEPLLGALSQGVRDMEFVRQCTPEQLADLVLAQLGPAVLPALRDALEDEGLQPPARWNTAAAVAFVTSIAFPPEFASSPEVRREPEESVSGPIELPGLHDFQLEVFDGLSLLLASGTKRRRAVISLPTGGGKTRVAVEAAVRLVLSPVGTNRSLVWVAQTDELCEQAVQAFRQVWVNVGAQRTNLRIVRLWGGNPTPAGQELDRPVVVVASIQTLNSRFASAGLEWLRRPGLVVIDECHHAITPSYTALLRWLEAEAPRPGAPEKDEPPIVGLSATPFRTDDEESRRLARRFDNRWLPPAQEHLYSRLRAQGVLTNPVYEALNSGVGLTDDEAARLGQVGPSWEGLDFERLVEEINQRLAGDARRNERLVKCIEASAERSILFFTNSVLHAEEMAARLGLAGIPAAAISGTTAPVARRYFLDRFQRGEIRVLCNHSVLTTGFDAPRTDMVLIARQVFSPVRYMQMVGRGLRGEKNGGTASCRIVTVVDNLGRFQDRHPYHYCRQYFSSIEEHSEELSVGK